MRTNAETIEALRNNCADFSKDSRGKDLSGVVFGENDYSGYDFRGANLSDAYFGDAHNLEEAQFDNKNRFEETIFPPGINFALLIWGPWS